MKAPKPSKSQLEEAAAGAKTKIVPRESEEAAFGTYAGSGLLKIIEAKIIAIENGHLVFCPFFVFV